ncbi:DUF2306 domain-containing protein [Maribacter sp. R77961]|uniref:DUF2306 domain-containing protein n=1 Tax=Maribacter sp. R77961 TaxID=3093871 RepID=UPI0037C5CA43
MKMDITSVLILVHAITGGVALVAGAFAIASRKGKSIHRMGGKLFFYSMLISALTALILSVMPGHENSFLFCIGIFSLYFLIAGFRALGYKNSVDKLRYDKLLSILVILISLAMMLYPILLEGAVHIVLMVFGIVGLLFGLRDFSNYKTPKKLKQNWLRIHLGKMMGAYIAAVSAFLVVNQFLPTLLNWFLPAVFGVIFIVYWINKIKKKDKAIER